MSMKERVALCRKLADEFDRAFEGPGFNDDGDFLVVEESCDGPSWCVHESFGNFFVRFEHGWYVQEGEADTEVELFDLMRGMVAASRALSISMSKSHKARSDAEREAYRARMADEDPTA